MALIFTPGQLRQRAEFYHQLAALTSAGLGLIAALQQLHRSPPARSYRRPLATVLKELTGGCTFTEALGQVSPWLPEFDVAIVRAGEQSGRLDACFRLLAEHYAERASIARQVLGDLAYPAFLFHFAILILPFPALFLTGNWVAYATKTLGVLVPIYALVLVGIYAAQSRHGEVWRASLEALLQPVPVLGTARRYLALARLAAALEALLSAGVTMLEAWALAAAASGSPALNRTVRSWRPRLEAGQTPAETLNSSSRFPELFVNQYATGEVSGKLDETLTHLHQYYQDEGSRKLRHLAQWTPRAIYLLVVVMIAYRVIQFWTGYFSQISAVMGP